MLMHVEKANAVVEEIKKAVIGKDDCINKIMMAILSRGHILIEDIPGVGKTTLALAFSKVMNLNQSRVQFTPDILPSDILGFSVYQKESGKFVYQEGPIMCNLFLADEINRTSPKTQSALLEVMEEGKVTVDGVTRIVPKPFIVMATQNPVGSSGTQKLPESQLDRFLICMSMGYPDIQSEIMIAKERSSSNPIDTLVPVIDAKELEAMQNEVDNIFVHDIVFEYIANLSIATRKEVLFELGVSPRGTIALTRTAKARAFLLNRDYVIPEDVYKVFNDVAAHRVHISSKALMLQMTVNDILADILKQVRKPEQHILNMR
jgi:MoxR-like ATPases